MKTVGDVLTLSAEFLKERKVEKPRLVAEELLSHILKLPRIELYMQFERPLQEDELEKYRDYIKRRAKGEPWQYIVGEVDFFGAHITVTPDVLIPRQETEILASLIAERELDTEMNVWDVCCGSGCLGISLKKRFPKWNVTLSDISPKALAVAQKNSAINNVDVAFLEGDLLKPFEGKKADLIICNPPYISEKDFLSLDPGVKNFEPKRALTSGPTGFELYERLAHDYPKYLKSNGKLYFEIGAGMGDSLKKLFPTGQILPDWAGHDRFFLMTRF
jgi:release factor glutamine methyltransferase